MIKQIYVGNMTFDKVLYYKNINKLVQFEKKYNKIIKNRKYILVINVIICVII